jgi:hypothetical protein
MGESGSTEFKKFWGVFRLPCTSRDGFAGQGSNCSSSVCVRINCQALGRSMVPSSAKPRLPNCGENWPGPARQDKFGERCVELQTPTKAVVGKLCNQAQQQQAPATHRPISHEARFVPKNASSKESVDCILRSIILRIRQRWANYSSTAQQQHTDPTDLDSAIATSTTLRLDFYDCRFLCSAVLFIIWN